MNGANAFSPHYRHELDLKHFGKRPSPVTETNAPILNRWASINTESVKPSDKSHALRKGTLSPQSKTPTVEVGASDRQKPAKERKAAVSLTPLSDAELELHISDCSKQIERAYKAYEASGDPKDKAIAVEAMERRDAAIKARSPEVLAARHAAFERTLDEGVDFFAVAGARDGVALRRAA